MSKIDDYLEVLRAQPDWDAYLRAESRLPGPRGNLELAFAVAQVGSEALFLRYAALTPEEAPQNTPGEFLAFCGALGLGYCAAQGAVRHLAQLRALASDPRWRVREAVAMGLQRCGDVDMDGLLAWMAEWSRGKRYEQRAVVAALCEPRLLVEPAQVERVLDLLDWITASILIERDRKSDGFQALRKGLAYGWSVAVAAQPELGKPRFERWAANEDPDVRWIVRQNLGKKRLERMDAAWVEILKTLNVG